MKLDNWRRSISKPLGTSKKGEGIIFKEDSERGQLSCFAFMTNVKLLAEEGQNKV